MSTTQNTFKLEPSHDFSNDTSICARNVKCDGSAKHLFELSETKPYSFLSHIPNSSVAVLTGLSDLLKERYANAEDGATIRRSDLHEQQLALIQFCSEILQGTWARNMPRSRLSIPADRIIQTRYNPDLEARKEFSERPTMLKNAQDYSDFALKTLLKRLASTSIGTEGISEHLRKSIKEESIDNGGGFSGWVILGEILGRWDGPPRG